MTICAKGLQIADSIVVVVAVNVIDVHLTFMLWLEAAMLAVARFLDGILALIFPCREHVVALGMAALTKRPIAHFALRRLFIYATSNTLSLDRRSLGFSILMLTHCQIQKEKGQGEP